ncbi:MAG TPA: hypothetical protein VF424_14965, partial [Vicinamibacterales bacterium]
AKSSILPMRRASAIALFSLAAARDWCLSFEPGTPAVRRQSVKAAGIVVLRWKRCQLSPYFRGRFRCRARDAHALDRRSLSSHNASDT